MNHLANRKDSGLAPNGASAAGVEGLREEIDALQAREAALLVELDYLRQNRVEHRTWGAEERERAAWAHHVADPEALRGYLDFLMPPELGEGSAGSRFVVDQLVAAYAESLRPVVYLADDEGEGQTVQAQAAQKPDYLEVLDAATREAEAEAAGATARVERLQARIVNGERRGYMEATARYRERLTDAEAVLQRAEQRLALRRAERLRIDARLRRLGIRVDATQAPSPDEQMPAQRWWRGYVRENLANLDEPIAIANRMLSRGVGVDAFFEFSMRTRSRWDFVAFDRETLERELAATTDINRRTMLHRRIAQVDKAIAARQTPWYRDAQILSETSDSADATGDDLYWFVVEEARLVASSSADARIQRAELMRLKGLALMSREQGDAAVEAFDQSLLLDPDNARAYNNRGSALTGKGDFEKAIDSFDAAILRDPGNASAYNNLGLAFGGQGDHAAAVAAFDAAIELHRGDLAAHNNRAFAQRALGNFDAALADCDAALRLDPACVAAYNNRGIALRAKGDVAGALAAFDQAILLDPSDATAYNNRALALNSVGDFDAALAACDIAVRLDPRSITAYNNRAFAYGRKGDFRAAVAASDAALRLDPDNAATWNNKGFALNSLGDYANAIAAYDAAIRLAPGYAIAYSNRGYSCFALGRYDDATEAFITTQNLTGPQFGTHIMEGVILLAQGPVTRKGGLRKVELAKQQGLADDGKLLAAFCQFLHSLSRDGQLQRLSETKTLFHQGVRLAVHGLESNVRQAVADAHIDAPYLPKLLAVLTGKADPASLSGWQFWRNVA